jgi:hypothetical protein
LRINLPGNEIIGVIKMPLKFAKLSTQKTSFIKEVAAQKRELILSVFESPENLNRLLPNDAVLDDVLSQHQPTIQKLLQKALAKDSKGFWGVFKAIDDETTKARIALMIYYCYKDFYPEVYKWFVKQMVEGKDVPLI